MFTAVAHTNSCRGPLGHGNRFQVHSEITHIHQLRGMCTTNCGVEVRSINTFLSGYKEAKGFPTDNVII